MPDIFERLADPRFEREISAFLDGYVGRGDTRLTAADLRAIYKEAGKR